MSTKTINAVGGPEKMLVTRTRNKEIVLTGVFNVMEAVIESKSVTLEEDFQDLALKDGESLELFGPVEKVVRNGDTLEYHYRRPGGFHIVINRDDLVVALAKPKPWWNPF